MNLTVSMAIRNALRSWRRSLITALAITLGTALLNVGMAWQDGMIGGVMDKAAALAGHVRVVTPVFSQKETLYPIAENISQTDPLVAEASKLPGVVAVYPRLSLPATVSVDSSIGEVFSLLQGAPPEYFTEILHLDDHIAEGRIHSVDNEVVVGLTLVEEAHLKLGDELIFVGQTQDGSISPIKVKVVGIADFGSATQNKLAYITLKKARYMADIPDGALELVVYADSRDKALQVARALEKRPGFESLEVKAWNERKPWSDMFVLIDTITTVIATVIVFLSGLVVLNTMLMSVLERSAEIGVLRALGMKRGQTLQLFVVEALGIAVLGGVLGAALGALGGWYLEVYGVNIGDGVNKLPSSVPINSTVYGKLDWHNLVWGMLLAQAMALVGSVIPAWRATIIQPVEAMRAKR
jgi:putative ABC transport system permease protein